MSLVARCTGFDEFEYPLYDLSGLGFFSPGFGFLCSLPQASPTQQPLCVILRAQRYRQSLPDEMARPTIDIDEQIDRLRAGGTLTENEVKALCDKVRLHAVTRRGLPSDRPRRWGSCHVFSGRFDMAAGHQGDMHGDAEFSFTSAVCWVGGGTGLGGCICFGTGPRSDTKTICVRFGRH